MRFSVRVPVLSEQITVTEPSVSTAGSLRTRARRWAMRPAPSASAIVTTAGSPSGMAATARLTAVRNIRIAPLGHQRGVDLRQRPDGLGHRLGLPGQGRLVDPQRPRLDQAQVSRDHVPGCEQDDVTRHQLRRGDLADPAGSQDPDAWRGHRLERGHRLLGAVLLDEADQAVEPHNGEDDHGVLQVTNDRGHDPGQQQDHDHRVGELLGQQPSGWLGRPFEQLITPEAIQATGRLLIRQAGRRVHAERAGDLSGRKHPSALEADVRLGGGQGAGRRHHRSAAKGGRVCLERRNGPCRASCGDADGPLRSRLAEPPLIPDGRLRSMLSHPAVGRPLR